MRKDSQVCTFLLDDVLFGVEAHRVQEIIRRQSVTPVPLAPDAVRGLINLRGQIVTAVDLRCRLGMPASEGDNPGMHVVLTTDQGLVSLVVDRVDDVLDVSISEFEEPPNHFDAVPQFAVDGIYKLHGRLLLLLNVENTLDITIAEADGAAATPWLTQGEHEPQG